MALKLSTGLRNWMLQTGSFKSAFSDCILKIYSGSPPAYPTTSDADAAPTGTLLLNVTKASGLVTENTAGTPAGFTLASKTTPQFIQGTASGASGTASVTITGLSGSPVVYAVAYNASIAQTLKDLCYYINAKCPEFTAICSGTSQTIFNLVPRCHCNSGALFTVADSSATFAILFSTGTNGVDLNTYASGNGLKFGAATAGSIVKSAVTGDAVWSGVGAVAAGTGTSAGYFRLVLPWDLGTLNQTDIRLQGTVGTSGTDLIMSSTTIVYNATTTVDSFTITMPVSL